MQPRGLSPYLIWQSTKKRLRQVLTKFQQSPRIKLRSYRKLLHKNILTSSSDSRKSVMSMRLDMAFPKTLPVSEAGGKPLSNGGRPEARLGSQGARSIVWAVAHVGRKRVEKWGTWCAEVGPMLQGDCPPIFGMSSRNGIFQPVFFDRVDYFRVAP